jgi:hypothetical protein
MACELQRPWMPLKNSGSRPGQCSIWPSDHRGDHDQTAGFDPPETTRRALAMAEMGPNRVKTPNLVFSLGVRGDRNEAFC